MREYRTAENIYNWSLECTASKEMGAWSLAHPDEAAALSFAHQCAEEMGYING